MNTREKLSWTLLGVASFLGIAAVSTDTTFFTNASLSGWLSLSGETNRLTVAGDALLLDGSAIGGETVWTNSAGIVYPVSSTNAMRISLAGSQGIVSSRVTSNGDTNSNRIYTEVTDSPNYDGVYASFSATQTINFSTNAISRLFIDAATALEFPSWEIRASTSGAESKLNYSSREGENLVLFSPEIESTGSSTGFSFGTANALTAAERLLALANNNTSKFSLYGDGVIATQGGTAKTPASAGAAGVAGSIVWDADFIYICVAANTWKRVAIATWP